MKTYSIYDAKTNFSKLIKQALAGEKIVIGARGKPAVELKPLDRLAARKSFYGVWQGQVKFAPDYDQADYDIAEAIYQRLDS